MGFSHKAGGIPGAYHCLSYCSTFGKVKWLKAV